MSEKEKSTEKSPLIDVERGQGSAAVGIHTHPSDVSNGGGLTDIR